MIIDDIKKSPVIIAGPCSVESETQISNIAKELSDIGIKYIRGGTYKPRTDSKTFQGLGKEGVNYLHDAAHKNGLINISEVLEPQQLEDSYDKLDMIQIGSRNMASYGLLKYIGKKTAKDKKPVLLKRGFSSTINELLLAAEYITNEGNPNVILCLRGIRTFEQIDSMFRFTSDLASIIEIKEKSNLPVFYDPSHSTGMADHVISIAKAALMLGADGLLIETHPNPEDALTDANQCILPSSLKELINFKI